ncbi:MAG: sel1 repeat family protein [Gammaproteobacteria bacterium]|nr:sel1 repeat family protein [Gammaproteobacteria bacterium]MDH3416980.1 sel1 repeat family protein [Gammaproteobacteria bacterium]
MRVSTRIAILLALLHAPGLAVSADLQKGLTAFNEGDYETSLAECQPLADAGNAGAQFCVGRLYANGFGVAMDDALAIKWYALAADAGHAEAQFNLGVMYANGWGVDMNWDESARLYLSAAEQGFVPAQKALAYACGHGMGVTKDRVQAYAWYDIAAQIGDDLGAGLKRDELVERMSAEDVAKAQQIALKWINDFKSAAGN